MSSSAKSIDFSPLLNSLDSILLRIQSNDPPPVMLAAQTIEDFNSQSLPAHCKVSPRKRLGPRVPTRKRRGLSHPESNVIARWPKDKMFEEISPSLACVLSGEADIHIVDYVVHCQPGDAVFLPAGIIKFNGAHPHYENVTPDSHCDLLTITFLSVGLNNLEVYICHSKGDQHVMSRTGESCWLSSSELSLIVNALSEVAGHTRNTESAFYLFAALIILLRQAIEQGKGFTIPDFPSQSTSINDYSPIAKAQEYIHNHLYTSLSIDLVARWVGLSRSVFVKEFRQETSVTFQEYLTKLRLEEAKMLLFQTKLSIETISGRVGLSSGQLRNLFHAEYNCTPGEFRHRQTKN